ncbi:MAG: LptA/OstA family protein [Zymomonas mobilis subsp. pomaceae]|uniref:LptA/OstA family protein n=1 Tax=Zymomonas mobilis TaxID=542 RepID=UPI0039E80369
MPAGPRSFFSLCTFIISLIGTNLLISPLSAQGFRHHDTNAPIDIDADHNEVLYKANRAIYSGHVRAKQADMTITAEYVRIAYTMPPAKSGGESSPQIQRLDASGGVTIQTPDEMAKGDIGIYDVVRRLITLIGKVEMVRGDSVVHGGRLIIDLNTGKGTVDGSAVGPSNSQNKGRVTGHFVVPPAK